MPKRVLKCVVTLDAYVTIPVENSEEHADPDGEMTDAEAAEEAVSTAIPQMIDVFVFGEDREPANVFVDDMEITVEGEQEQED
jgi:hypothetical protein